LPAQPFEFVAGESVTVSYKKAGDTAGGLFAGGSGPKPPPALSTAVIGMKPGGRVSRQSLLFNKHDPSSFVLLCSTTAPQRDNSTEQLVGEAGLLSH